MSSDKRADVAVVGAGIVGLAFAWEAARRGRSVVLFDRTPGPQGASVRNFGMVWPIGQLPGPAYERALRSRARWLELKERAGLWVSECGSLHVAHDDDEDALLREFAELARPGGIRCEYLPRADALGRFPAINPAGFRGALHSPTELAVNPPDTLARLPRFLADAHGVQLRLGEAVTSVEAPQVRTAAGDVWRADRVFVCSGADFETLFPETFAASGIRRCKLQMMKTRPQPNGWRAGPHIAGGLTLCHYKAFELCSTLPALKARIAATMPEYVKYGIHVMASQNDRGEVVIGDSHEYDADISVFDKTEIDELILKELRTMIDVPDWTIGARWHGVYAKHPEKHFVTHEPHPGCVIAVAPGGLGMTMSFALAEDWWNANT
ncbi:TIGR03364 family FAD-dependent oxidoreductase [Gemmata sp. JC717]|uniref:TIGR03364 family FAD-dependent oxidoreductase n=1 Tax=Gemmata algarum TaxID=2975278 RepID=UPI0021BA5D37|nr:TIGR03364 family FAD-dependent oxidoreductase [Gemmata algarum]MDY3556903.1 TIGR03364 family FAD-dependent oxidoreductase [Gemmata algarum]